MKDLDLAIIFPICDGDKRHFDRFEAELARLDRPYACHFDHCCKETIKRFGENRNCVGYFSDNNPSSYFDEMSRQHALDVIDKGRKHKFKWVLQMDIDETLEKDAMEKIEKVINTKFHDLVNEGRYMVDADVIDFPLMDLWGDSNHYRVDGPFSGSHREKLFNLQSGEFKYYHPTSHAPKLFNTPNNREAVVIKRYPIYVFHWGIMSQEDVVFHTQRWDEIYIRKVGGNPYGFYPYINDPNTVIELKEVPQEMKVFEK